MNNSKKVICVITFLNSFFLTFLVAGQNYNKQLARGSTLYGLPRNDGFNVRPVRSPVYNSTIAPYTFKTGTFIESISSSWSAIPVEIKIVGGLLAIYSLPSLYYRINRWLNPSEEISEEDSEKNNSLASYSNSSRLPLISSGGMVSRIQSNSSLTGLTVEEDSFERLFPCAAQEEMQHRVSLGEFSMNNLMKLSRDQKKSGDLHIKLDGITLGDTPGGPDLILRKQIDAVIYDIACEYYEEILNKTQLNEIISKVIDQVELYPGLEQSASYGKDSTAYALIAGELHEQVREHSQFNYFVEKKKKLFFKGLLKSKGEKALQSVESVLIKVGGEILDVIDNDGGVAAIRITVPNQGPGLACGAHSIINMLVMNKLLKSESANFLTKSRSCFNDVFADNPLEQNTDINKVIECAHAIGLSRISAAGISEESAQKLVHYDKCVMGCEDMSEAINQLIKRKVSVVHILLSSISKSEDGDHRQHWSNISVVYTNNMEKPVVVLMDSLKNQWSAKAKPIVSMAVRLIAKKVDSAMARESTEQSD